MTRILTFPEDEELLRRPAKKVKNVQDVTLVVQQMKRAALDWEQANIGMRCEGLAATQIGVPLRIVIARNSNVLVPPKYLQDIPACKECGETPTFRNPTHALFQRTVGGVYDPWYVLINPRRVKEEGEFTFKNEACLSVPGILADTQHPAFVAFDYYTPSGKRSGMMGAKDSNAAVIDHELRHLDGKLFIDFALPDAIRVLGADETVPAGAL